MTTLLWYVAELLAIQVVFSGHAAVRWAIARCLGLPVARVRVGWGPKLHSRQTRDGARLEIRALPPLAMVAIAGHDAMPDAPSYRALHGRKDLGKRLLLTLSSPGYYVLLAVLPLFVSAQLLGWTETAKPSPLVVAGVMSNSPAAQAGIAPDDAIVRADGKPVRTAKDLIGAVSSRAGVPIVIELRRGDRAMAVTVTPEARGDAAVIGVTPKLFATRKRLGVFDAAVTAFTHQWAVLVRTVSGTIAMYRQQPPGVTGPVGMGRIVADESDRDRYLDNVILLISEVFVRFLLLVCLPLPFCAGGRLLLLLPEALGRTQPSARVERWMTALAIGAYLALLMVLLIRDLSAL